MIVYTDKGRLNYYKTDKWIKGLEKVEIGTVREWVWDSSLDPMVLMDVKVWEVSRFDELIVEEVTQAAQAEVVEIDFTKDMSYVEIFKEILEYCQFEERMLIDMEGICKWEVSEGDEYDGNVYNISFNDDGEKGLVVFCGREGLGFRVVDKLEDKMVGGITFDIQEWVVKFKFCENVFSFAKGTASLQLPLTADSQNTINGVMEEDWEEPQKELADLLAAHFFNSFNSEECAAASACVGETVHRVAGLTLRDKSYYVAFTKDGVVWLKDNPYKKYYGEMYLFSKVDEPVDETEEAVKLALDAVKGRGGV